MDLQMLESRAIAAIAAITVATGAAQMAAAPLLLPVIAPAAGPAAPHLFATVGMFMVLFGAATLHASRQAHAQAQALPLVLLWGGLQKLGAAAMVAWGVTRGVFLPLALLVAGFDFASGLLYLDHRRRLR